jgi:hypothetical protein
MEQAFEAPFVHGSHREIRKTLLRSVLRQEVMSGFLHRRLIPSNMAFWRREIARGCNRMDGPV